MKDRIRVQILVIDDEESICHRLAEWLQSDQYEVATFTDAAAGLAHAVESGCDVALIDLRQPKVEEHELIASIREAAPHACVIGICAFPETDQVLRAIRAGACDLLEKPIQRELLIRTIERHLAEIGIPVRHERGFNERLGSRLRRMREQSRRTQQEVAELAGITSAQLSQIECGKTATSTWTLARIGGALRVPLVSLFDEL